MHQELGARTEIATSVTRLTEIRWNALKQEGTRRKRASERASGGSGTLAQPCAAQRHAPLQATAPGVRVKWGARRDSPDRSLAWNVTSALVRRNNQKKKRNHWVPQSYLRAFAADFARREKIWTFGKVGKDPELKAIRKVATRFYLYAPNTPHGRDYSFEDKLASLEQLFGLPVWQALGSGFVDLREPSLRKGVALLAAVMFLRNPLQLEAVQGLHGALVRWFAGSPELPDAVEINGVTRPLDTNGWEAYRDAGEDAVKQMWLDHVGSATWLAEIFMQMRWAVVVSETPAFITTDNPVIALHESLTFRGFRNAETTVVFPLSPTRVLSMDWRHSEPDGAYYAVNPSAAALNLLMWRGAINMMFAPRHPDEVCADMLRFAEQQEAA